MIWKEPPTNQLLSNPSCNMLGPRPANTIHFSVLIKACSTPLYSLNMHQDNPIQTKGGFLEFNVAKNHLKKHVRDSEHTSWCFMLFYKQLLSPICHNIDVWMHYWKAITERSAKWHVLLATPRTVVRLREEQSSIILSCITKPVKLESGSAWLSGEKNNNQWRLFTQAKRTQQKGIRVFP